MNRTGISAPPRPVNEGNGDSEQFAAFHRSKRDGQGSRTTLGLSTLGMALSMAACGGGGSSSPTTTPPPSNPNPNPTPEPDPTPPPEPIVTSGIVSPGTPPDIAPSARRDITGSHEVDSGTTILGPTAGAMFVSSDPTLVFTNNGTLWSVGDDTSPLALYDANTITNNGTIVSVSETTDNFSVGTTTGRIINTGDIFAISTDGQPAAIYTETGGTAVENSGNVYAESRNGATWGIIAASNATIENSGLVEVASGLISFGIEMSTSGTVTNSGTIHAMPIYAAGGGVDDAISVGIRFFGETDNTLNNSGDITADISVISFGDITINNTGRLAGILLGSDYEETITNEGEIDGPVILEGGDDFFQSIYGTFNYFVDGGDGADTLIGSVGDDSIYGDAGHDSMQGGEGNDTLDGGLGNDSIDGNQGRDWIFGARGNDILYGNEGNDGLYGGVGDDWLGQEDGDRVAGGLGDDNIEITDGEFALLDGGEGFDYLAIYEDRAFNLSPFAAAGKIKNIEGVKLFDTSSIALDGTALAAMIGGATELRISGGADNTVYLTGGGWTLMAPAGGYQVFENGGRSVYILDGVDSQTVATAPAGMIEPTAPDDATPAPEPGDLSAVYYVYERMVIEDDFTIFADETFEGVNGGTTIRSTDISISLTNNGTVIANAVGGDDADAAFLVYIDTVRGNGDFIARSEAGTATGLRISTGDVDFDGNISATSTMGSARGISINSVSFFHLGSGEISVDAQNGTATGIVLGYGGTLDIDADLDIQGNEAVGIRVNIDDSSVFTINGDIVVSSSGQSPSIGIEMGENYSTPNELYNHGSISADIAYSTIDESADPVAMTPKVDNIYNFGTIAGDIHTYAGDDRIENQGNITGDVYLGENDDTFVASSSVNGIVDGGAGEDTYEIASAAGALDFSSLADDIENFETILLSGAGDFDCDVSLQDVLDITDANNELIIVGDAGDEVTLAAAEGWVQGADDTIDGDTFQVFTLDDATLYIHSDVNVI